MLAGSSSAARRALEQLGVDPDVYDEPRTRNYILVWAQARAAGINAGTLSRLEAAVAGDLTDAAIGSTPAGVFDKAEGYLAQQQALTLSTQVSGWGAMEAARQQGGDGMVKTWRSHSSRNPRSSHRRMNGETVPIDEKFSNGADWPGDSMALPVEEVANCHCTVEITRESDSLDINIDNSGASMGDYRMPRGKFSYSLSLDENKAKAFEASLGYTEDDWQDLAREVLEWHKSNTPEQTGTSVWGDLYRSDMTLTGKTGKETRVFATWIDKHEGELALTSLYVKGKRGES